MISVKDKVWVLPNTHDKIDGMVRSLASTEIIDKISDQVESQVGDQIWNEYMDQIIKYSKRRL